LSDHDKRISELEKQMFEVGGYTSSGNFGAFFGQDKKNPSDWETAAELLYWQTQAGGTEYAYSVAHLQPSGASFPLTGQVDQISFDWSLGFRIGAGRQHVVQDYDLFFMYTWYKTQAASGHKKELPSGFLGLTGFLDPALTTSSHYHLSYQNIDIEMGKNYYVSSRILVRSHIGLKLSRISQKQNSSYDFNVQTGELVSFSSHLRDYSKFLGIGPRIGVNSRWYITREFSLYNQMGISLLYGYFQVKDFYNADEEKIENSLLTTCTSEIDLTGFSHKFSPYGEMLLGLSWNRAFLQDKFVLTISLNYETLYFWRQIQKIVAEGSLRSTLSRSTFNSSRILFERQAEDIGFRGISLKIEMDF